MMPWKGGGFQRFSQGTRGRRDVLAEAEDLKGPSKARGPASMEDGEEVNTRKGRKNYEYWMASWRRGSKVHNEYHGICKKMIDWRRPRGSRL
jgi:hypothetical protein